MEEEINIDNVNFLSNLAPPVLFRPLIKQTFLRCERQLLHRLPNTKALVFNFKTYLYAIREIKEEALDPKLADAIEGLRTGSVPQMWFYKRGVVWGEKVAEF